MDLNPGSVSEYILLPSSYMPQLESTAARIDLFLSKWPHHPLGHRAWILGGILDT